MAALPENDRMAGPYIAAAGQTDFPADFPLIKEGGLRVRRERGGASVILSPPDVAAVNQTEAGFTCRLATAAQAGDRLFVYSELPAARMRSHTPNGAVRTATLEDDATEAQAQLQEVRRDLERAVSAQPGEAAPALPSAAARAGRFLAFDDEGGFRLDVRPEDFDVFNRAKTDLSNVLSATLGTKTISAGDLPSARALALVGIDNGIRVEWFGAKGDGVTDDTGAIQATIDYIAGLPGNLAGGVVLFGSGVYRASNLVLKARVRLRGMGYGQTQIRRVDGGVGVLLLVPKAATLAAWDSLCFDGNNASASGGGYVIEFEATVSNAGQSFSPAQDKVSQVEYSYKMASCWSFCVINGRVDGVRLNGSNFDVRFMDFRISHCLGYGLYVGATDCLFANGYIEKCGLSGLHIVTGANKFVNIKSIFNCRQDATPNSYANVWVGPLGATPLTGVEMYGVEAQDGYGDGFFINAQDSIFSINANTNGYKAFTQEDQSSRVHTNVRIGSSARRNQIEAVSHSYKSAVGSDGFWTTEWPYVVHTSATFTSFKCDYDPARFNQPPTEARDILANGNLGSVLMRASAPNTTFMDLDPKTLDGTGSAVLRLFRNSQAGLIGRVDIQVPGTSTLKHRMGAGPVDPAQFCLNDQGNLMVGSAANGGRWNTSHLVLGPIHYWTDALGRLRTKNGTPTSDTDGELVATKV